MRNSIVLLLVVIAVSGCITTTNPDGSVEQRVDVELAAFALDSAITAYNLYQDIYVHDVQQSRLSQLLDDIERAESLYNRLREQYGKNKIIVLTNPDGTLEVSE